MAAAQQLLSDVILDRVGVENVTAQSKIGRLLRESGPSKSGEFRRVHNLPRRRWEEAPDLEDLVKLLSDHLSTPAGKMKLWPVQAAALREAHDVGGLFGPIAVGKGKALISLLAAVVMQAKRPLLIVPAALREQTNLSVLPEMAEHWQLHPALKIVGYTEISLAKNSNMLEEYGPDLIVADEVHRLKNKRAGRTKRISRYMSEHSDTRFVALSGTVTNQSIKDYAHILRWCLKGNTPLPESWQELSSWADVLDVDVEDRPPECALSIWAPEDGTVRQGYRDRLTETPGVIATKATELGVSLSITARRANFPPSMRRTLAHMIATWETPGGDTISEAIDLWRHVREVCLGFYYKWDPLPPRWWLDPRKAWKKDVRETLKNNRKKLDTELQVWNECADQHGRPRRPREPDVEEMTELEASKAETKYAKAVDAWQLDYTKWRDYIDPKHCLWCGWLSVKGQFEPNTVAEWVSDFALRDATKWMDDVGGIVWTEHVEFGERLAAVSGRPYFGAGKKANEGIATHRGACIASVRAHCEGKNLQHHSANLIVTPSSSGKTWEQLLGRTHREGQKADEVTNAVYLHAEELLDAFRKAMSRAEYLEHTLGSKQKLLYADIGFKSFL
ncbi:MAG: hypothetical protein ACTSX8_10625 [Alphaproteobacteria bacterium]